MIKKSFLSFFYRKQIKEPLAKNKTKYFQLLTKKMGNQQRESNILQATKGHCIRSQNQYGVHLNYLRPTLSMRVFALQKLPFYI